LEDMPLRAHYEPLGPIHVHMQLPRDSLDPSPALNTRSPRPNFQGSFSGMIERDKEPATLRPLLHLDRLDVIHAGDRTFALVSIGMGS